jgi:hypothetical protein
MMLANNGPIQAPMLTTFICLNVNEQIRARTTLTKLNLITNTIDNVPKQNKSNVVYEFLVLNATVGTLVTRTELSQGE